MPDHAHCREISIDSRPILRSTAILIATHAWFVNICVRGLDGMKEQDVGHASVFTASAVFDTKGRINARGKHAATILSFGYIRSPHSFDSAGSF